MRKFVVSSIALVLVTLGSGDRGFGEEVQAPRGELRVVDKSPLNWASITLNVLVEGFSLPNKCDHDAQSD